LPNFVVQVMLASRRTPSEGAWQGTPAKPQYWATVVAAHATIANTKARNQFGGPYKARLKLLENR